ncbi:A-kinase anchor protein 13 isoform X3 [Zophobas morio]|uniref:A-kinase anchor protein 13 isoform X3 n=1 Tax=Zophobas morio TaxID=2755281 RepID=UPI0030833BDF
MEKQSLEEVFLPLSSDECGHSGGDPDSDEDVITNYHISNLDMLPRPLPTISVTPHSPATKIYPVLEDNLQQLREIHESVQNMRNVTIQEPYGTNAKDVVYALNPVLPQAARFSSSCPALNETVLDFDVLDVSLGSSPLHSAPCRKGSGTQDWLCQPEIQRRRSWSAVEDLTMREATQHYRQRSVSLSSMESEGDEPSFIDNVDGSAVKLLDTNAAVGTKHRNTRTAGGANSTHSLNEADLKNDFNKIIAKREAEERLLPQRLPLQKSISTPSIIAVRDVAPEPALTQPTLAANRPSGTESETEEEGSRSSQVRYPHSADTQYKTYEGHAEKRRKRGSLFFRKKKDKNKKNTHQWVSACYGSSQVCNVCNKALNSKPALCCECCGKTVHQNVCKDNVIECTKYKGTKHSNKLPGLTNSNPKSSLTKRGSTFALGNDSWNSTNSQILSDEKDTDSQHGHNESTNFSDDTPLIPPEFLSESPLTASDLCSDLNLRLHENEPDSWTSHVGKEIARKLKEKEIKRQEHIYEFILTEKHHCITLLVMQKIFVDGLEKYFQLGNNIELMFPRLADLTEIHLELLTKLRQRQKESAVVSTIADILLGQFSNQNAVRLKSAYGEFCSKHRDAVGAYKEYLENDSRFEQFIRHCQSNPLLKKKGIPECILFITQRLTKYPLLIEPLIKTSKDNKKEQEILQKTLSLVKEILVEVDSQVAEKEKEDRKIEIYKRIDAKSYTVHRNHKFKKSDILQSNRSLKFEGDAMLMQGRGKMHMVKVIVLSDVLFFLQTNSDKYTFFTPDNKAGVISLQKLLVREKAGQDSRGIYLISSNPADPEMFELKVHKPKDKQIWIHAIREAVQCCPEDDESSAMLNAEEQQSVLNTKQTHIRHLVGLLRQKDIEQALLLEEKMSLQLKLLTAAGIDPPSPPSYKHLVSENVDTGQIWKEVLTAVQEVSHLASSLYTTGTNLSRSVSSAGEHQSEAYVSPILPKRAETFGGFDNSNQVPFKLLGKKINSSTGTPAETPELDSAKHDESKIFEKLPYKEYFEFTANEFNNEKSEQLFVPPDGPALLSLGREQQYTAIQLSHYVYTLLCIISQLMTTNESYQAQINILKTGNDGAKQYRHNQQLEELRNLQDKFSAEKAAWIVTRDQEAKELEEKRADLLKFQEQIRSEQEDIKEQREQLFRTMEKLTNKGLIISPNVGTLSFPGQVDDNKEISDDNIQSENSVIPLTSGSSFNSQVVMAEKKKENKWNKTNQVKSHLPLNLISATNQQKVSQNVQIKQQIPLKLASRLSSGGAPVNTGNSTMQLLPLKLSQEEKVRRVSSGAGYQRLSPPSGESTPTYSHSRTGSSPAMMEAAPSVVPQPQQQQQNASTKPRSLNCGKAGDEEIIYF